MLNKIYMLREKLEKQLLNSEPYESILRTSIEIDELLVEYYKNSNFFKIRDGLALVK